MSDDPEEGWRRARTDFRFFAEDFLDWSAGTRFDIVTRMPGHYWVLDVASRTVRPARSIRDWEANYAVDSDLRRVGGAWICDQIGERCAISTVFLGINHAFGSGPPKLFETLVMGGRLDQEIWRYATWDDAWAGHQAVCLLVMLMPPLHPALPAPPPMLALPRRPLALPR